VTVNSESPFERIVLFTYAEARTLAEEHELWWLFSKYGECTIPNQLFIPPEAILPLGDDTILEAGV
jgi:hypothetical protein